MRPSVLARRAAALAAFSFVPTVGCGSGGDGVADPGGTPGPVAVASVVVSPATLNLTVGDTARLTAQARDAAGNVLTGRTITWASSDSTKARVAGGLVTAVDAGGATITATAEGRSGSAQVAVAAGGSAAAECDNPQPAWVFCDDFEVSRLGSYFEYDTTGFSRTAGTGKDSSYGMRARFAAGQVQGGVLHLAIGKTPQAYFRPADAGTAVYRDLYWRVYVRYSPNWQGGGGYKLSRAFSFASTTTWAQAMIAHVWSGNPPTLHNYLLIDPASGTDTAGNLRTTQYNDFNNFRWLGLRSSTTPVFDAQHVGLWYCVEAHARYNDPGQANGVFELWIDGTLEASRSDLNWVGSFGAYGINAVYLENYWNTPGSPQAQERWLDNFVVSTQRIGC